jgi:hypothetical protein
VLRIVTEMLRLHATRSAANVRAIHQPKSLALSSEVTIHLAEFTPRKSLIGRTLRCASWMRFALVLSRIIRRGHVQFHPETCIRFETFLPARGPLPERKLMPKCRRSLRCAAAPGRESATRLSSECEHACRQRNRFTLMLTTDYDLAFVFIPGRLLQCM